MFPNKIKDNKVKLKEVTRSDCRFLYKLLRQRDPITNISHKAMPTYSQHEKFVLSKPYSKWYTIRISNKKVGSIYLSHQNEIGIFFDKKFQGKGIGKSALQLLMKMNPRTRYLANVNPRNLKSIKFFKRNEFKLIQHTYETTNPLRR